MKIKKYKKQEYIKQHCPRCKSTNLDFDIYEPIDDFFKHKQKMKGGAK